MNHRQKFIRFLTGFGIVAGSLLSMAHAQPYPAKPVRFVSPFAPGGPTDLLSRPVGARLQETLGQPFVVDYKAGASGVIGADHVA